MRKHRIAILMHEKADRISNGYLVGVLADYWRGDGHSVVFLYGTQRFISADILFVHVDLSVVPDSYLTFAKRYPVVVNGGVKDIRKSTFSEGLLQRGDNWEGPVIIKSNNNYAGRPELKRGGYDGIVGSIRRKLHGVQRRLDLRWLTPSLKRPRDYKIYAHLREVPRLYFYQPGLVVQKFRPEMDHNMYCLRIMLFLGNRMRCTRLKSKHPIINSRSIESIEYDIEPHPKIIDLRNRLGFDYGKFDYVVPENQPILLDTNKTVGRPPNINDNTDLKARLQYHSEGLYSFFERRNLSLKT